MNKVPLDPFDKLSHHIDAIFGKETSKVIPVSDVTFEYSKRTGRIKSFSINSKLAGTFRTDGGIALTVAGAEYLLLSESFIENCVIADPDAVPFVREGRSLFCRHVKWCGSNIFPGSDTVVLDGTKKVLAIGRAVVPHNTMTDYTRGVAVRIREGIKSRNQNKLV